MKTAITLPAMVATEVARYAEQSQKTTAQVVQEAIAEYLERHVPAQATAAMNRVVDATAAGPDAFVKAAARRALEHTTW